MADTPVTIVPHDPAFARRFAEEAVRLLTVFAGRALGVEHVGSTAVPGLAAKPILDMLLLVPDLAGADGRRGAAEAAGYDWRGEYGIAGRRYLVAERRGADGAPYLVHVHAFEAGTPDGWRHVAFRDYLLRHRQRADAYGALKRDLAARLGHDRAAYTDAKSEFVRETDALALAWLAGGGAD